MLPRHALTDQQWNQIRDLLPGKPGDPGRSGEDNRLFVDAVLFIAKTGVPWRDLPERFGNWIRRRSRCIWLPLVAAVARKKNEDADRRRGLGRSRGGLNTKIHGAVDRRGHLAAMHLSPGQDGDGPHGRELLK